MNIVRFSAGRKTGYGILKGNVISPIKGSPFAVLKGKDKLSIDESSIYKLNEVKLLAPCLPSKVIGIGLNYHSHANEVKVTPPAEPQMFLKPSTSIIGPEEKIIVPRIGKIVEYEGELAVVIGKKARNVPENKAREYVLGYTCFNDVSDRYYQKNDMQWTRAKCFDTFSAIGPYIVVGIAADDLKLETYVNGQVRQSSRTNDLIFGISKVISFASSVMTLLPGDVIATGTPAGVGRMNPGDIVEIKIEKIGTLRNTVAAEA